MQKKILISVDIGSTWTKAAKFAIENNKLELIERSSVPTTVFDLVEGFLDVLQKLHLTEKEIKCLSENEALFFSSSAKGGLKIVVVGLVPEMSLHIGKLAACSAGGKVCAAYSYQLTNSDLQAITEINPDIILLCGGTDGGNEKYIKENAKKINNLSINPTIIYAGNRVLIDELPSILINKEFKITQNVMPEYGRLNIEPAQKEIQNVFLEKIIYGKGLDKIKSKFGITPVPTPYAVYNLIKSIGENIPEWNSFAVLDMGGATTDVYTFSEPFSAEPGQILRGIQEPKLKRTVEGDLGMRVSSKFVAELGKDWIEQQLSNASYSIEKFNNYVTKINSRTEYLPSIYDSEEIFFDKLIAEICVNQSIFRHSGSNQKVFTVNGPMYVQQGKNLELISKVIGSGGYLAFSSIIPRFYKASYTNDKKVLSPVKFTYYIDKSYMFPILGNLSFKYPSVSAFYAIENIEEKCEISLISTNEYMGVF